MTVATTASRWVSMRKACEILGVNPATLRQWTDEGKVPAYVTPGGHRRYDESVLHAFVERPVHPMSEQHAPPPPFFASHDQYESVVRRYAEAAPWLLTLGGPARTHFRMLGNSMLHLLGSFTLADSERERETSLARAREVSLAHGGSAAENGLTLREAMGAFQIFKGPVIETLAEWSVTQPMSPGRLAELIKRVNHFIDQVLLAMVEGYEEAVLQRRAGDGS